MCAVIGNGFQYCRHRVRGSATSSRPPATDPHRRLAAAARAGPQRNTDWQLQNIALANQVMRILGLLPENDDAPVLSPTWLVDWDRFDRGKQDAIKWRIREQLGRMALQGSATPTSAPRRLHWKGGVPA